MKLTNTLLLATLLTNAIYQANSQAMEDSRENPNAPISHNYQKPHKVTYNTKKILQGLNKNGLDSGLNLNIRINCNERGYFKDPINPGCNTFIMCDTTETGDLFAFTLTCPNGWMYNPKKGFCSPFYKCK